MAGWSVLFQVEAQSRQFAVWHQDQVVKLLPIKGLVGQEMALDDYLQYILQEALAAPRRSSARRGRQSPTATSLGGGSLISSFIRQLSQALALMGARAGNLLSLCWTKTRGTRNHLLHEQSLCLIAPSSSSPSAFSLCRLSFSRFYLCRFDEPTQAAVTMTESHTDAHPVGQGQSSDLATLAVASIFHLSWL